MIDGAVPDVSIPISYKIVLYECEIVLNSRLKRKKGKIQTTHLKTLAKVFHFLAMQACRVHLSPIVIFQHEIQSMILSQRSLYTDMIYCIGLTALTNLYRFFLGIQDLHRPISATLMGGTKVVRS